MDAEIISTSSQRDLLNREAVIYIATTQLGAIQIPEAALSAFATLAGIIHPETITSINEFAEAGFRRQHNPKTGLMFERSARNIILDEITRKVVDGAEDLVICETDMNDLKGLNDRYGESEADKAISKYASWIREELEKAISASGKEINYAIVNVDGEGSDSMKIIIFGKDVYQFSKDYVMMISGAHTKIELTTKVEKASEEAIITGGWGYYVLKKDDAKTLINDKPDFERSGLLYTAVSQIAKDRMSGDKLFNEASLIQKILEAKTILDLESISSDVVAFGERIPRIILQYYFRKQKELIAYAL